MTWSNKRKDNLIKAWLDRSFGNDEWRALFPAFVTTYLEMIESDHRLAVIQIRRESDYSRKFFTFDHRMIAKDGFRSLIQQGWLGPNQDLNLPFSQRLRRCRQYISEWRRENPSNSSKQIKEISAAIDSGQTDPNVSTTGLINMKYALSVAYKEEEEYWYQKSRIQCNSKGDRNIRFFMLRQRIAEHETRLSLLRIN